MERVGANGMKGMEDDDVDYEGWSWGWDWEGVEWVN